MPRRRPGAVRALRPAFGSPARRFSQVDGLSRRTAGAVRRLEAEQFWPGSVAAAIATYQRFLRQPGRVLYPWRDCPCCDPVDARDHLQDVLRRLSPTQSAELRKLVAEL